MLKPFIAAATIFLCAQSQAAPIIASNTGLIAPATTITFDEVVLPDLSPVTNQYATYGVTFSPNVFFFSGGSDPNINGNVVGSSDFDANNLPQFSILFSTSQTDAAFALEANNSSWDFQAFLGNVLVEAFSANVLTASSSNFFGFTGIIFDKITISNQFQDVALLDNLQYNATQTPPTNNVPEPTSLVLIGIGLIGVSTKVRRKAT